MGNEVPGVKRGPLARALSAIRDPAAEKAAVKAAAKPSRAGGKAGRGRGGSSAASSRAGSCDVTQDAAGSSSDGECEEEEEEAEGAAPVGRGRGKAKKQSPKWKRGAQSALERAAGELHACGIKEGCRWVAGQGRTRLDLTATLNSLHVWVPLTRELVSNQHLQPHIAADAQLAIMSAQHTQ